MTRHAGQRVQPANVGGVQLPLLCAVFEELQISVVRHRTQFSSLMTFDPAGYSAEAHRQPSSPVARRQPINDAVPVRRYECDGSGLCCRSAGV